MPSASGAVARHRAQLVGIGAHHVGQHVRVAAVALGAGHAVPLPVPRRLQRVHREHHVPGRDQRGHPRAAVGLDPDDHLRIIRVLAQVLPDQLVQPGHPGHALGQPPLRQHPSRRRPSAPRRDGPQPSHPLRTAASALPSTMPNPVSSLRENYQRPNETVLTPARRARHPSSDQLSRSPAGARSFGRAQSPGGNSAHLPAATRHRVCRTADPLTLIRREEDLARQHLRDRGGDRGAAVPAPAGGAAGGRPAVAPGRAGQDGPGPRADRADRRRAGLPRADRARGGGYRLYLHRAARPPGRGHADRAAAPPRQLV